MYKITVDDLVIMVVVPLGPTLLLVFGNTLSRATLREGSTG
jgi:hypothetical protein